MTDASDRLQPGDSGPAEPDTGETVSPVAWHVALLQYLKTRESELWKWFSSHQARSDSAEDVRLELLKTAYRIDRSSATAFYETVDRIADRMNLPCAVTVYQAQKAIGLNASLAWLPDDAHVVLHGPVLELLTDTEQAALLAHELAHHELYTIENGDYLVVEQILSAMTADQAADAPHERTWRTHRLWTELHCDRRAVDVTDDPEACICALVKLETGLKEVSASAYLEQADEVLQNGLKGSEGITHPEMFIRAKALQLWRDNPDHADEAIKVLVEGPLELKSMDLLRQQQMTDLTAEFVCAFLADEWMQTNLMLEHARRFLTSSDADSIPNLAEIARQLTAGKLSESTWAHAHLEQALEECDEQLRNYFCYILLDFATCDPDLEEGPLAAAFLFAQEVGLLEEFRDLAAAELRLSRRLLRKTEKDAEKLVAACVTEFTP